MAKQFFYDGEMFSWHGSRLVKALIISKIHNSITAT
jgi:hypothetical protein